LYNYGGAIYNGTAVNCAFDSNYAEASGGAISIGSAVNSTFNHNSARNNGGAIYEGNATNCIFSLNSALAGGVAGVDAGNALYGGYADSCIFNGDTCLDTEIDLPVFNTFNFVSTYNSTQKLIFNITTKSGMPLNDANVKIKIYTTAGSSVGTYDAKISGWKVPLNAGTFRAVCTVAGYDVTGDGLIVIDKAKSTITSKAVTAVYNNNKYLVITLKDNKGKAMKGAKVTVTLASAKTYKTDANGQIKINIGKLVPKTYTAKIKFAGNTNFLASSTTAKVVVKKATPKMTAKAKTFKVGVKTKKYTITLKNNKGAVMKNTKVTITVNKKTFTAKTNSKGVATFKITNLKKKGKFTATIKYAGSKYYNKVTKKPVITVKK
jgi:predicted outer membrane repeat protein